MFLRVSELSCFVLREDRHIMVQVFPQNVIRCQNDMHFGKIVRGQKIIRCQAVLAPDTPATTKGKRLGAHTSLHTLHPPPSIKKSKGFTYAHLYILHVRVLLSFICFAISSTHWLRMAVGQMINVARESH